MSRSMAPGRVEAEAAARLRFAVNRLFRRMRQTDDQELTPGRLLTLASIEQTGSIRLGDLAARELVTPPTMTRVVQVLERLGYVQRQPDPLDGRSSRVELTVAGKAALDRMRRARTELLARRLARLAPDDRDRLVAALPVLEQLALDEDAD